MALTPAERRIKNQEIKAFHQHTLDALKVPNALVMSKMAYKPTGFDEKHISLFESEIKKGEDIYIEFGDIDMQPEKVGDYPLRSLHKYRFNANFRDEYPTSDPLAGNMRYFIPISELIYVEKQSSPTTKAPASNMIRTTEVSESRESKVSELLVQGADITDLPMSEMTIRDYAAIHLQKKISNKKWLNDLIPV